MTTIIGITADLHEKRHRTAVAYSNAILTAGGIPIIIPPISGLETEFIEICDGFVFTGGDDPNMEEWGIHTHPNTTPVSSKRQAFELSLLMKIQENREIPVLGICLGMQWMSLIAGGSLEQDLQEPLAGHHADVLHQISGSLGEGLVHSHHHQAMNSVGSLEVISIAEDGVIEAVRDSNCNWYIGVQWHPERTEDCNLGQGLFKQLVHASSHAKAGMA